jgi:hypothetical protein
LAFSYFRYSDKTAARILSGFWPEWIRAVFFGIDPAQKKSRPAARGAAGGTYFLSGGILTF